MRRLGGRWWLCIWRIIGLGDLRGRSPIRGTVDVPRFLGTRGGEGIRSKKRSIPACQGKGREGHEMHSWSRTLAAWLPEIRFLDAQIYIYIYKCICKSTYL